MTNTEVGIKSKKQDFDTKDKGGNFPGVTTKKNLYKKYDFSSKIQEEITNPQPILEH